MSPRRSQTDEPRPEAEAEVEQEEAREQEPESELPEVTPLVEGAPVSAAARHNARYGTP